jgi:hypothetical protein
VEGRATLSGWAFSAFVDAGSALESAARTTNEGVCVMTRGVAGLPFRPGGEPVTPRLDQCPIDREALAGHSREPTRHEPGAIAVEDD